MDITDCRVGQHVVNCGLAANDFANVSKIIEIDVDEEALLLKPVAHGLYKTYWVSAIYYQPATDVQCKNAGL